MNELDKLLELAGIIVSPDAFDARNKKDDVGITIDDMQINAPEDDENEFSFAMNDDEDDDYDDLGVGLSGIEEGGAYQAPSTGHIGGGSQQFTRDLDRLVGILKDKGITDMHSIKSFADKIIKQQGYQAFDGVQSEYVAKAAMEKLGIHEAEEDFDDLDFNDGDEDDSFELPPSRTRGAKPEPDLEKAYDKWYWEKNSDKFEEGIEDDIVDDGEILDLEPSDDEDDIETTLGIKPKAAGAKPEPDFNKKYDDWYWNGKGDKTFEEDDLSNGYGKEETFDEDDLFPNGFDSPVQSGKGPEAAGYGGNPMNWRNKMAVKESIQKTLYQELINFKKKG